MSDTYFSIHNHSDFTNELLGFPDSVCKLTNLIQNAYDIGLSGLAITEHEGISSHIKALNYYNKMQKDRPFTLALGNEIYLMDEADDVYNRDVEANTYPYYHFILIALDTIGHSQLRQLSTRAWIRAWKQGKMYRRATYYSDLEEIVGKDQGHIFASTACLGSKVDKLLLEGEYAKTREEIIRLCVIFGIDNLAIECQPASEEGTDQSKVNRLLKDLSKSLGVPMIVSTDSHYLNKEDSVIHKTFLLSQEGDREVDDFYKTAYMMSASELREYLSIDFTPKEIDDMFLNTQLIQSKVKEYNIFHNPIIPQVPQSKLPTNYTIEHRYKEYYDHYPSFAHYANIEPNSSPNWKYEDYFFKQIEVALKEKVEEKGKNIEQYIARLDEEWKELIIISEQLDTSMASYYQTMSYIIDLIWEAGSLAMPARGSAAGFLTCYLLEVTQIDPVPLGDYFPSWRHLNHLRGVELPD